MEMLPEQNRYYALDKLSENAKSIATIAEILPAYRARMEKYLSSDKARAKEIYSIILKEREQLVSLVDSSRLCLLEMGEDNMAVSAMVLRTQLAGFNLMTPDYARLEKVLRAFADRLPVNQTTNAAIIGRLMNNVRMGHYPTDPAHIEQMVRGIAFPSGVTTNVFDPCCGTGIALRTLATGNNCYTYGVEIDEQRAEEAQARLHRVAFGSFFHSRISHESFHVMLLNPPYLSVLNESGNKARHEKRFLAESYEHLMQGGLLLYIVPYYRLTPDIARILCDNFTELSVYRFIGEEFQRFRQVVVMGKRRRRVDGSGLVSVFMEAVADHMKIPELSELPEQKYAVPVTPKEVSLFKGAMFNVAELARQLASSKSLSKKLIGSVLDNRQKRPILPLNVGQVGLIGGSGMINGLAMCDNPHIIKGRIVKELVVDEEVTGKDAQGNPTLKERTEVSTNKLVFNILTANGFKSLNQEKGA